MTIIPCGILLTIMCSCTSYKVSWHPTPPLHGRSLAMFVSGPGLAYVIKSIRHLQLSSVIQSTRNHPPKWDLMFCPNGFPLEKAPHPLHILEARHGSLHLGRPTGRPTGTRYGAQSHQIRSETKALEPRTGVLRRKPVECQLRHLGYVNIESLLSQYTLQHDCESKHLQHFGHYTLSSPGERMQNVSNVCLPGPKDDKCPVASFPGTCQLYITCLLQGLPPPNGASIVPSGPQAPGKQTPQTNGGAWSTDLRSARTNPKVSTNASPSFRRTRHQVWLMESDPNDGRSIQNQYQ